MKKKLIFTALGFIALLAVVTFFVYSERNEVSSDNAGDIIVAVNEIEQLIITGEADLAAEKTAVLKSQFEITPEAKTNQYEPLIIFAVSAGIIIALFLYIWFAVLRPFSKLEKYADSIAAGNFDTALDYERTNYFGKFTWAFDSMRREIVKARTCEKEAIENNKTVIATLSHDIRTPIASIRAYTEGLEAGLDSTPEKRQKYLSVIMNKCDEVSRLTNDMFLHSLSDLEKLRMNPERFDFCAFVQSVAEEIDAEQSDVRFEKPAFSVQVNADKNRLTQIMGNIITNARKYAKTEINVKITRTADTVSVHFRDCGGGIPDEDIPFIFGKFYRGKNCGNEQGSGLGLYIVKYVMEQSGGTASLKNCEKGLEVTISLPFYENS